MPEGQLREVNTWKIALYIPPLPYLLGQALSRPSLRARHKCVLQYTPPSEASEALRALPQSSSSLAKSSKFLTKSSSRKPVQHSDIRLMVHALTSYNKRPLGAKVRLTACGAIFVQIQQLLLYSATPSSSSSSVRSVPSAGSLATLSGSFVVIACPRRAFVVVNWLVGRSSSLDGTVSSPMPGIVSNTRKIGFAQVDRSVVLVQWCVRRFQPCLGRWVDGESGGSQEYQQR